jgi:phosphate transport system ATP-binding protein
VSLGELRKKVGMVFQRPNPLPLSIYENVAFGLRVHSAARTLNRRVLDELVESALTEVLLWNEVKNNLRQNATSLSLEQQQKLCIARLLPLKPHVILMDEPCSALDAQGVAAIERLMSRLRNKYTIAIVTHNMAQARRASDRCVFMLLGEVIEQGPTLEIFLRPKNKQTELYIEGRYG